MTTPASKAKWIGGLHADTPLVVAARRVLRRRLKAVTEYLPLAAEHADEDVEHVHQLRVATRRSNAALQLFEHVVPTELRDRLRRKLRRVRRAAAAARCDDVHAELFSSRSAEGDEGQRQNCARQGSIAVSAVCDTAPHRQDADAPRDCEAARVWLLARIRESRAAAQKSVCKAASGRQKLERRRRELVRVLRDARPMKSADRDGAPAVYTLGALAAARLPGLIDAVRTVPITALQEIEAVHALRIAGKRLRYALEIFAGCFPPGFREDVYPALGEFQDRLGDMNDLAEAAARLESLATRARTPGEEHSDAVADWLDAQAASYRERLERRHTEFLRWWSQGESRAVFAQLAELARSCAGGASPHRGVACPERSSGQAELEIASSSPGHMPPAAPAVANIEHRRVAALDVGTNSIRLVVAETDPLSGVRIVDDVKETTRLGEGLYSSGMLSDAAIDRSIKALERMRAIADGYHVERLRAVGTSAVREARNGRAFVELARQQAGVSIETIDADKEARLAFSSVIGAFDLSEARFATVDLGGGSAELVLSTGGLIDAVHKLPLGAVRLTEAYGSDSGRGEYRYGEMRRAVDRIIADVVGDDAPLDMLVGTGGTFTSLARMSIRRGAAPGADGRFPFAVRGFELPRDEVTTLLDMLRKMPLAARRRVPGLSTRRAEIIVAGVCVVERLMERLRVRRLRVHDGGIRDGLLAEMIDDLGVATARGADAARTALAQVRDFARRSDYERDHSEHVTRLALRIFDQLAAQMPDAAGAWARRECRDLLRAAGILHDVGIQIDFRRHHRHSYDMIVHADLPAWSRREVELIANIARYHRRGGPKPTHTNFRRLSADDQRLVAHLAGILRVADGMDRLHTQNVTDVLVHAEAGCVLFEALAESHPHVNLRFAARKADVFETAFHARARFGWRETGAERGVAAAAERSAGG